MQILYFGRRDKKSVDVIAVIRGNHPDANETHIDNVKDYIDRIPADFFHRIATLQNKRKMDWQLCVMNAKSSEQFLGNLAKMGYSGIPSTTTPLIYSSTTTILDIHTPENKKMLKKLS